jgi:hypothetical protein|nr:MAG TPA: hypothetical protein [Caudoviricetes sp.]
MDAIPNISGISEIDILMISILDKIPNWKSKLYYEVIDDSVYLEALEEQYEDLVDIVYNRLDKLMNTLQ